MQSIICKYMGPTNTKGSRVKAVCAAGSLTVGFHSSDRDDPYLDAAEGLCKKLGWVSAPSNLYTPLIRGDLPNGDVVFTFIPLEYEKAMQAVFETRLAISKGENNGNPHGRPWGKAITYLTDDNGSCVQSYKAWAIKRQIDALQANLINTCGHGSRARIQAQIDALKESQA